MQRPTRSRRPRVSPAGARPTRPRKAPARKADTVAEELLAQIVAGNLRAGSVLPREEELAERFGVNRSVVREAIKSLEVHSLVRPVRRRGTEVLDPMASVSPRVLRAMLSPVPGRVDVGVLAGFLEVRALVDREMTERAAVHRTPADVARMRAALDRMRSSLGDAVAYNEAHGELSNAIGAAAGNIMFHFLAQWHQAIAQDLDRVFSVIRQPTEQHLQGMTFLVDLVERGDRDGVRELITRAHEWSIPRMLAAASLLNGEPLGKVLGESTAGGVP